MPEVVQGVIHGKTIELLADPGIKDGATIEVTIRPMPARDPDARAVAAEASAVPRSKGWKDSSPPHGLQSFALSLSPPVPAGMDDEEALDSADHPANERALATLKNVRERRSGVSPFPAADAQDYLRKARAGGMYGDEPDEDPALPDR